MDYVLTVKQRNLFNDFEIDEITKDIILETLSYNYSNLEALNFYTIKGCFVYLNMKNVDGITIIEKDKVNEKTKN